MAAIGIGNKYPCQTQGVLVPVDEMETVPMYPGDVVEIQYEYSSALPYGLTRALYEIHKMKEKYPNVVIHYVEGGDGHVVIQVSAAPPGGQISNPLTWVFIAKIAALAAILLGVYLLALRTTRGYIFTPPPPTGDAVITAMDMRTLKGIAKVGMYIDGTYVGKTGTGGSIKVTKILEGMHRFAGEIIAGYWPPDTIQQAIIKDQIIDVTIAYNPDDQPQPTKGWLEVYTHPISGRVWVAGQDMGLAPIGPIELERGNYSVTYGYVDGYITPKPDNATIQADLTTVLYGYYKVPEPEEEWYEKYIKWALIGGGAILGTALILPEVVRAIARRRK